MTIQSDGNLTLRVERTIRAPRERVYQAWTDPEEMKRWSAPVGMTIPEMQQDLRVGGKFRTVMIGANGTKHVALGEYREVSSPKKLVYTHSWLKDNGASEATTAETIVTVEFLDEGVVTRVVLTQTGFDPQASRDGHMEGWTSGWCSALDNLVQLLKDTQS